MKGLSCLHLFWCLWASNSEVNYNTGSDSKANSPIWPKIKLFRDNMPDLLTCKFEEDPIKNEGLVLSCFQHFPHYKSMGASGASEIFKSQNLRLEVLIVG